MLGHQESPSPLHVLPLIQAHSRGLTLREFVVPLPVITHKRIMNEWLCLLACVRVPIVRTGLTVK